MAPARALRHRHLSLRRNAKGGFYICRLAPDQALADVDTAERCWSSAEELGYPRSWAAVSHELDPAHGAVAGFAVGDHFELFYVVGGGGGHALYLSDFEMTLEPDDGEGDACTAADWEGTRATCSCTEAADPAFYTSVSFAGAPARTSRDAPLAAVLLGLLTALFLAPRSQHNASHAPGT